MNGRLGIGDRVRHARRELGWTQGVLADYCGITASYLSEIERGVRTPSPDRLLKLATALRVTVGTLVGDDESRTPAPLPADGMEVAVAMMEHLPAAPPPLPAELQTRVDTVWQIWQSSPTRFTQARQLLPVLIRDADNAARAP